MTHILHRAANVVMPVAVSASGVEIVDAEGRRYLDASGGAAVSCLGHGHPDVLAAMRRQLEALAYAHTAFFTTEVAERFFSNAERAALRRVPEHEKAIAFFRCWTRKEAFVKVIGTGIGFPLNEFDVSIDADSPDALLSVRNDFGPARRWLVRDLPAEPDFAAALAVVRPSGKILAGEPIG